MQTRTAAEDRVLLPSPHWSSTDGLRRQFGFLSGKIADPSGSPVETIVELWPLSSAAAPLFVDGRELPAERWIGTLPHATFGTIASAGFGGETP